MVESIMEFMKYIPKPDVANGMNELNKRYKKPRLNLTKDLVPEQSVLRHIYEKDGTKSGESSENTRVQDVTNEH
jgi:hypothetical protein